MKTSAPAARATRESWAIAGLEVLSTEGVEAVAVEPIAKRLGVTKGSFYWHFKSRVELLEAALDLWERRGTQEIITELAALDDPRERLRQLFRRVAHSGRGAHAALSAAKEPEVRRALQRVAAARLAFLELCYLDIGMTPSLARRRSFLAYAAYLGMVQLACDAPSEMLVRRERDAYTEHVIDTLIPEPEPKAPSRGR